MAAAAPVSLKADDLLARVAPDRADKRAEHDAAKAQRRAEYRKRFPLVASMLDTFRESDARNPGESLGARPVFARNDAGEAWGAERDVGGMVIDGEKLAHLPEFEASWRRFYAKQPDDRKAYNERAQRGIKPHMRGIEE
ncbi:hypothetical protein [Luteibacter yeojuensis]|uniref:Uncharacterized protein n=1 Tax=Luteibacter yeojuensis TaxID=345309 RepID=A0A7X5TQD8_9GAMM|nr:hypothetical protein [Luteibacter yeojuensis]NID15407.1 hypothetical protein [Luteibacter yeojuensis]